jgi:hypothetical protein
MLSLLDGLLRLTYWGRHRRDSALGWFDAAAEGTVPSLLTAATMATIGVVCLRRHAEPRRWWRITGALFTWLAVDDVLMLHERFGALLQPWLGGRGVYVWVFTLAPLFAILALLCVRRLWPLLGQHPGRRGRLLLGFAALGVAIGFEVFEDLAGRSSVQLRGVPILAWTQWCEETLELVGPVLLLAALWPTAPAAAQLLPRTVVRFVGAGR